MTEPNQTNARAAGAAGETVLDQTGRQLCQVVPGLPEAVVGAFSVPLGPAILLGLVLQQLQGRLPEANAGPDGAVNPLHPRLQQDVTDLREQCEEPEHILDSPEVGCGQVQQSAAATRSEEERPAANLLPARESCEHPTAERQHRDNSQRPTSSECLTGRPLDVRNWMFDVGCSPLIQEFNVQDFSWDSAHEPLAERGRVAGQPQRLETVERAEADTLPARAQPSSGSWSQGAKLPETPLPAEPTRAVAAETMTQHSQRVREILDLHAGKLSEILDRLSAETRQQQQQILAVVEVFVAGQVSFAQRLLQLEAQLATHRNTGASG